MWILQFHLKTMKNMNVFLPTIMFTTLVNFLSFIYDIESASNNVVRIFSDENVIKFNHLVVDKNTGYIYVGAVNRLYQLYPDLESAVAEIAGPQKEPNDGLILDNYNKILVIDYSKANLIACGSSYQGTCTVRSLQNISEIKYKSSEQVVSCDATASTVAFIAPGPEKNSQVLYVGATYTKKIFHSDIPAVSSRSLDTDRLFNIAVQDITTATRILLNSLSRESYIINYIYGFSSKGFSYFMTVQPKSSRPNINNHNEFLSKLVRVCHQDKDYYSYTEIPIECTVNNAQTLIQAAYVGKAGSDLAKDLSITAQDDVLFTIFSVNETQKDPNRKQQNIQSALCIYSLKSIRRKFMQNIRICFNGTGNKILDFIASSGQQCTQTKLNSIDEDFCGLEVNTPLGGELPVTAPAILLSPTKIVSIAATSTGDYTVVFLGTENGHLKKVVVDDSHSATEYGNIEIDVNSSVNPDMHFDPQLMYLYVMTQKKVSKVKVQECSIYKNCLECLNAKDPYCGWCSLETKCSLRSDCQDAKDPLYWISYKSGKCTTITSVTPNQLQRTIARTLNLVIDNLPSLSGEFLCAFTIMGKVLVTPAARKSFGVNCTTPRTDILPAISPGKNHLTAKLSVRMTTGPDFVATNFTFFDCNTYTSCTKCVSSSFPCDWCIDSHRCTHDTAENCRNNVLVTGVSRTGLSYQSGPNFCLIINSTNIVPPEIFVAAGTKKSIQVKVHITGTYIIHAKFVCQFNIEGRVTSVNAYLIGDTIYCDSNEFTYNSRAPNITGGFAVIYGGSKPLDNPDNLHIVIYRCREMADNCGSCLLLAEKYQCGWCQSTDRCEVSSQCDNASAAWLHRNSTCPNPEILSFSPLLAPWKGHTNITIKGINLGKSYEDIFNGISVAGIECQPYKHLYIRTREIVCLVDSPRVNEEISGPVVVTVEDYRGESKHNFQFVNPVIESIYPTFGPKSGGTILHITGKYMNAGSQIEAFINDLPCKIVSSDHNTTLCITSEAHEPMTGQLKMSFGGSSRVLEKQLFQYNEDPVIESVESGVPSTIKIPKGIPLGGIKINVTGKNFRSIQSPKIYVYYEKKMFLNPCTVYSETYMVCESPSIDVGEKNLDADNPLELDYGFQMDNVLDVRNLTSKNFKPFSLYPNPTFDQFDEEVKYYKSDYLTINGQNINKACKESDFVVKIGDMYCNVTSLSGQHLTCRPPQIQPAAISDSGSIDYETYPKVVVIIGGQKHYIGKLAYELPQGLNGPLTKPALIGVICSIILLLFIFTLFLIAYRRKSTESNRVLKNMQEQMDILELRVAAECKEAFAELQTEMTDLTGDLTSGGIPFLDYRTYAMKILFPNTDDHVVLQWEKPELLRKEKGLRLFGQLIMNKTFLLLFIRTLESNRYFSMRDRVNVASLVMVTLQSKMEYCTDILKTLLAELIEKCIEGKSHPKLLLRRTESVAEKMLSAWFTFLLYKFLRECAGEPLYMLFRAVKYQVDKGPVDAVTSEARYSLSEEKLIRQSIDFKHMTIFVSIAQQSVFCGLDTNTENVAVKVLDCDTISQVKEKALDTIYRATPYSQRPRKDDLDLEWRTGSSGRLVLHDEDSTTKTENEWKKRNTLSHYRVADGAMLSLVPKQSSVYNFSLFSDKNDKFQNISRYETLNLSKYSSASPPISRATSPLNQDHEQGVKIWHLVKHHDSDNQKESGERGNKMVSEIYLTRLLATKGTLQKFVDDLFETIFSTAHRGSALPLAIKYMFDFLDDQALQHGITDSEVVHTWKNNSLPLRFWVNLIKNPNFVFDIHKSNIVDSCLSVVAQTFMDSCSTSDHRLGKDSPSSKLLYAKDIPCYKEWVERYYSDIKMMSSISDQDMNAMLAEESRLHSTEFNTNCALHELYAYAMKYNEQLTVTLEEDEFSQKQRLANKLEQVHNIMSSNLNP